MGLGFPIDGWGVLNNGPQCPESTLSICATLVTTVARVLVPQDDIASSRFQSSNPLWLQNRFVRARSFMSLGTTEATTAPCSAWKCVGALGVAAALLYLSSSGSAESQTVSLVTSSAVKTQGTTRVAPPVVAPAQSVPVAPAPQAPGAGVRSAQRTELHTIRSSAGPTASDFLEVLSVVSAFSLMPQNAIRGCADHGPDRR